MHSYVQAMSLTELSPPPKKNVAQKYLCCKISIQILTYTDIYIYTINYIWYHESHLVTWIGMKYW